MILQVVNGFEFGVKSVADDLCDSSNRTFSSERFAEIGKQVESYFR